SGRRGEVVKRMAAATAIRMAGSNPSPRVRVKIYGLRPRPATALALAVMTSALFACGGRRPPRPRPAGSPAQAPFPTPARDRGWGYLKAKLIADGISRDRVDQAFGDPRMAPFDGLYFSPYSPRESHTMYRNFLRDDVVAQARQCREENARAFESAERRFAVP